MELRLSSMFGHAVIPNERKLIESPLRYQLVDSMMHCIVRLQDRATFLSEPPRARQHEVLDEMLRNDLFRSSANITFTELVNLGVGKGLVDHDLETGILTVCALVKEQDGK